MSTDSSSFRPLGSPPDTPAGINGGMPLTSGTTYYSDETKKQLGIVGWSEGDPLPPNFAETLSEMRREVRDETLKTLAELPEKMADYVPPKSKMVDIETLPPEKQAEIRDWLASYRDDVKIMSQPQPAQPQPVQQQPVQPQPVQAQPVQAQPTQPQPTQPAIAAEQSGLGAHVHCLRCKWPVDVPFNVVATEQDKQQFLIAILGGNSYHKEYELFGNSVRLRVRSLTIPEATMVNLQLGYMVRAGVIAGNLEYTHHNMIFRTAIGTTELKAGVHVQYSDNGGLEEFAKKQSPTGESPTVIPEFVDSFTKQLKSETVVRIVIKTYTEFQRLTELLEEMTNRPDFWSGINL